MVYLFSCIPTFAPRLVNSGREQRVNEMQPRGVGPSVVSANRNRIFK